jgi:hypothetical protein
MDTTHCEWKYILHFNNIWRIPNDWNEHIIFTENGINYEAIPNYLNITLMTNNEEDDDYDENENDSIS